MGRYTTEMKLWLFDVSHNNLSDSDILKGFICHYVMHDEVVSKVLDDIRFHTMYGVDGASIARENIIRVLGDFIES